MSGRLRSTAESSGGRTPARPDLHPPDAVGDSPEPATLLEGLGAWASALELEDAPPRVAALTKSQILSQLAAARASIPHELGQKVIRGYGSPVQASPSRAAYVLAALTVALDFDDTMYAGHVSHSTVNVPLAYARYLGLDGRALMSAVLAGNESAARITAAATLGPFRGQTAAHTHLVGAAAARMRAERATAERWAAGVALALTMPPWMLMRPYMGSDAKVLSAAVPVGIALDACDGAAGGVLGATDVLEHSEGFLARFAAVPLPEIILAGLGTRWHTDTLSLKVHPGSAYVDSAVECAIELRERLGRIEADDVAEVEVAASVYTVVMEHRSAPYVAGGGSPVVALNLSVGYNVATALLAGALTPADLSPPLCHDSARWALAEKVRVTHDPELTRRAVLSTAPLGEALRVAGRERAADWLGEATDEAEATLAMLGPAHETFEDAEKALGARVTLRLRDGRELHASRDIALGAVGSESRDRHAELMREKFLATGGDVEVADAVEVLEELPPRDVAWLVETALELAPARARYVRQAVQAV